MLWLVCMKEFTERPIAQLAPKQPRAQTFKRLLEEAGAGPIPTLRPVAGGDTRAQAVARIPLPPGMVTVSSASTASAVSAVLNRARAHANSEAERLEVAGSESQHSARSLTEGRAERSEGVMERAEARVFQLLKGEAQAGLPPAEKPGVSPQARTEQALALIERIELFVRSQRPSLALTLNNSLGARVEVERMGPKVIALRLVGHRGPPTAEAVSLIRDELRARGLKVAALSVG